MDNYYVTTWLDKSEDASKAIKRINEKMNAKAEKEQLGALWQTLTSKTDNGRAFINIYRNGSKKSKVIGFINTRNGATIR